MIFENLGFDATQTLRFQSYNSIIALAGELACILFIDKLGRRWVFIGGNFACAVAFAWGTGVYAMYPASVDNTPAHVSPSAIQAPQVD